jgi:hypothetical protein
VSFVEDSLVIGAKFSLELIVVLPRTEHRVGPLKM